METITSNGGSRSRIGSSQSQTQPPSNGSQRTSLSVHIDLSHLQGCPLPSSRETLTCTFTATEVVTPQGWRRAELFWQPSPVWACIFSRAFLEPRTAQTPGSESHLQDPRFQDLLYETDPAYWILVDLVRLQLTSQIIDRYEARWPGMYSRYEQQLQQYRQRWHQQQLQQSQAPNGVDARRGDHYGHNAGPDLQLDLELLAPSDERQQQELFSFRD